MINRPLVVTAAVLPLLAAFAQTQAQTYGFDSDSQGWAVYDIPYTGSHETGGRPLSGEAVPLDTSTGLPAPALRVTDLAGETWIGAPVGALGAREGLYGQAFAFDILFRTHDPDSYAAVGIEGPTLSLWISAASPPLNAWLHRSYPFIPGAWRVNSIDGPTATEAQIRTVLANLTGVYIHTEWKTGSDDTSVDNIVLGAAYIACGPADVGATGGVPGSDGRLDNNDFVVYVDTFFSSDPAADVGQTGGIPGADDVWDNNDFIVFIDQFFTGC